MALSSAVITFNVSDMLGIDFDTRRTKAWTSTNVDNDTLIDTAANQIRLGDGKVAIGTDGTGSFTVWIPGAGANPASWQTYFHFDYIMPGTRERTVRTFGPYTLTGSAGLASLETEQAIPPNYQSGFVAQAQAFLDQQEALAGIDSSDSATAYNAQYGTLTKPALTASIAAIAPVKWVTGTAYTVGQIVQAPDGGTVKVVTAHTSTGTYDATKFAVSDGDAAAIAATQQGVRVLTRGIKATRFTRWRRARARQVSGVAPAKVMCWGDSTTRGEGSGSAYVSDKSFVARLIEMLNGSGMAAVPGLALPPSSFVGGVDARWVFGAGWSNNANGFGTASALAGSTSAAADSMTYTPGYSCDTFDVYYLTLPGQGTVQAHPNAEANTAINTSAANGVGKATITVTAGVGTGHVLKFGSVTVNSVFIIGVDAYVAADRKIRVGNGGVGSSITGGWANAGAFNSLAAIKATAPDLSIISLGINDGSNGVTVATWTANMGAIIDACLVSGDVLLMSVIPSDPAASSSRATLEAQYRDAAVTLAETKNVGFVDLYSRFGSYASANSLGFMTDALHPSATGYVDAGSLLFQAVREAS